LAERLQWKWRADRDQCDKQETGRWANIRAEKFHQPFRRQCQNKILERSLVVA
jgi:hypothetical protein